MSSDSDTDYKYTRAPPHTFTDEQWILFADELRKILATPFTGDHLTVMSDMRYWAYNFIAHEVSNIKIPN